MTNLFSDLKKPVALICLAASLSACSAAVSDTSVSQFHSSVQALCGQSFEGRVVSDDPQDDSWRKEVLTLGPITCVSPEKTTMALNVGADKSRVWSLDLMEQGQALEFKHAHSLKDGSPDPVTNYGGMASDQSTAKHVIFPVDQFSIDTFRANGLDASVTNVWSFTLEPEKTLTYALRREGREFIAVFDLAVPLK